MWLAGSIGRRAGIDSQEFREPPGHEHEDLSFLFQSLSFLSQFQELLHA